MGARRNLAQAEETREKIRRSQIVRRLLDAFEGKIELTQVQAMIGLRMLDKIVPNLASIETSGDLNVVHLIRDRPLTPKEWEAIYCEEPKLLEGHAVELGAAGRPTNGAS
jgi:hypothetical protein